MQTKAHSFRGKYNHADGNSNILNHLSSQKKVDSNYNYRYSINTHG